MAKSKVKLLNFSNDGGAFFHVEYDGARAGYVSKYRNTRSTRHPWKAYAGKPVGFVCDFWPENFPTPLGAKKAAVALVADIHTGRQRVTDSPEVEAFVVAIRIRPTDKTARLVFADWLDERGEENDRAAAAWLRLDVQAADDLAAGDEKDYYRAGAWASGPYLYFSTAPGSTVCRIGNLYYAMAEEVERRAQDEKAAERAELGGEGS